MRDLIIFRGLPGSGKTTLANVLAKATHAPSFSIDDYFTDPITGQYDFRHLDNHHAYRSCFERTESAMKKAERLIFLHNTFTLEWEIEPYFKLAADYGYRVFVATIENYHNGLNEHAISADQIEKMAAKYKMKLH
jgi:tRNA uridine 5-carbamoylmethylation protein Kti12